MAEVICSNGEVLDLPDFAAGVATGFGRILNPYFLGDPEWKMTDGETVVECRESDAGAMPVGDAYQELRRMFAAELAEFEASFEHTSNEESVDAEWLRTEQLYELQDALSVER